MSSPPINQKLSVTELAELVKQMRDTQKKFFRGNRELFDEARRLEREVDAAVERITTRQGSLFE